MILKMWLLIFLLGLTGKVFGQGREAIFELNKKLGRGVNIGNMFEAPTENAWGNPYRADYFQRIASLGFQHVRIPIRWETPERAQMTEPYTISPAFLARIKDVVDEAHRQGLYAIINMHHHEGIVADPAAAKPRFLAQWRQIAAYFEDYDEKLLFEVMNEPHGALTPEMWNEYFAEALGEIRKTNPSRAVVMDAAFYSGLTAVPQLKLPDDPYLIVSPHYYHPFRFTHQGADWVGPDANGWLGTEWLGLESERQVVAQEFAPVIAFSQKYRVPIYIGEFGAYHKADLASRKRWTNFLARWFEQQGFSWAYWEFSADFGIFNPVTNQYVQPLVDALLHDPMPAPTPTVALPLYASDFSTTTTDWNLYVDPEAAATMSRKADGLTIDVQNSGTRTWQVQLDKSQIPLVKGNLYQVSFLAQATTPISFTTYLGKATAPYHAYSGYENISVGSEAKSYSYVFKMTDASDAVARLTFDLGTGISQLRLKSVKVEELHYQVTGGFERLEVLSSNGQVLQSYRLRGKDSFSLNVQSLPPGMYLIRLKSGTRSVTRKLLKQ